MEEIVIMSPVGGNSGRWSVLAVRKHLCRFSRVPEILVLYVFPLYLNNYRIYTSRAEEKGNSKL